MPSPLALLRHPAVRDWTASLPPVTTGAGCTLTSGPRQVLSLSVPSYTRCASVQPVHAGSSVMPAVSASSLPCSRLLLCQVDPPPPHFPISLGRVNRKFRKPCLGPSRGAVRNILLQMLGTRCQRGFGVPVWSSTLTYPATALSSECRDSPQSHPTEAHRLPA